MDKQDGKKPLSDRFTEIYNDYKGSIYKFCLVRLNGDSDNAEDCMQSTFMVLYNKLRDGQEILNPRAYLYKIANNFVLKCIENNAKNNSRLVPLDDYTEKVVDDRDSVDSNLDYQLLNERLNKILNTDEQQLLKLKYIDDMSIEQVAQVLQIKPQAVAKRLQRLREKIKHSIDIG